MKHLSQYLFILSGFCLFFIFSCKPTTPSDTIVVSIEPLRYFVERITDHQYPVTVLVPPGASPETFEPSAHNIKQANNSKLFIVTGVLGAETNLLQGISTDNRLVLIDSITPLTDDHSHHVHINTKSSVHIGNIDPHIWLSPAEARIITQSITQRLCALFPDSCSFFRQNCTKLCQEIDSLDQYMLQHFSSLPSRYFIIYHPALGYLARQYGLQQIAIEKDGKEPTGSSLKALIDTARIHHIQTLFCQAELNNQAVRTIAKEINGKVETIDPLAYDWLKNMYAISQAIINSYQ